MVKTYIYELSDVILEELKKRERRKTISLFGLDIHVNPEQGIKMIELNGSRSGYQGLEALTGRDITCEIISYLKKFGLEIFINVTSGMVDIPEQVRLLNVEKADKHGYLRNIIPSEYRSYVLRKIPRQKRYEGIVWNLYGDMHIIDENRILCINPYSIETASGDKEMMRFMTKGLDMMPKGVRIRDKSKNTVNMDEILALPGKYVVIKPVDGCQGKNIVVAEKESVLDIGPTKYYNLHTRNAYEPNLIVEELVPSVPIRHKGKDRFASMRYVIMVHSDKGKIKIKHFGGYWRAGRKDISDSNLTEKYVLNYSRNAIPLLADDNTLSDVERWIESQFTKLYRRLLRLPMNERPDDFPKETYFL